MPLCTSGDDLGLLSGIWMESYIRMGKIAPSSSLTLIDTWGPLVSLPRSLPPFLSSPSQSYPCAECMRDLASTAGERTRRCWRITTEPAGGRGKQQCVTLELLRRCCRVSRQPDVRSCCATASGWAGSWPRRWVAHFFLLLLLLRSSVPLARTAAT